MEDNKPTNRERLREITEGIEQGIRELFESEKYMRYLSVMSRFHRYSVNNTMLIYMQKPDATLVAGFNKWKNQFERHVKKGEHGITIIAPTPFKKKIEEQKTDPDTKAPILDQDGKIVTEEKEVEIPMFRPVKVFDVSQTDGKPLSELASNLQGSIPDFEIFMEALKRSAPVPIEFKQMEDNMDGYFSSDEQRIALRSGMSEVQTVSAAVHEIAHSKLHNQKQVQIEHDEEYQEVELFDKPALFSNGRISRDDLPEGVYCYDLRGSDYDPGELVCVEERVVVNHAGSVLLTEPLKLEENGRLMLTEEEGLNFTGGSSTLSRFLQEQKKDRHTEEVEAESISYAVCQYYGIQTGENSFGYIASWSKGKELKELRASLETINKTAGELIQDIDRYYQAICAERGINPAARQEQEKEPLSETIEMNEETKSVAFQETLLVLDDAAYLHLQPCDTGWDYTLYDLADGEELDGGQLDTPNLPRSTAALQICEDLDMGKQSIKYAPLSMIETLQEGAYQQMQAKVSQQIEESSDTSGQLPDAREQVLDEYPMPDPVLTQDDLEKCGYLDNDLLPLSKERAYELMAQDLTVYIMQEGEMPAMAFDTDDLDAHDGIFAVSREEWEDSAEFHEKIVERDSRQEQREQAFLAHKADCFAIYQVKDSDELRNIRYEGLDWLKHIGRNVERENYELVYTAPLTTNENASATVERLWDQFNNDHPADYHHPSMSVSDIVAIKKDGAVSCHYCDSFGFSELSGFLPENPLKNAEMSMEDDYGMIDGIINNGVKEPTVAQLEQQARNGQPISLMDLAAAAHREEREKKKSVVEQLKGQGQTKGEYKKTASKKSAEREL